MNYPEDVVMLDVESLEENIASLIEQFENKHGYTIEMAKVWRKFDNKPDVSLHFTNGF